VDQPREPLPTRVQDAPPLPSAYAVALDAGLRALDLELSMSARAAIDGHARLMLAWTAAINLTAIRDPAAVALAHVVDSLSAIPVFRERGAERSVDLGSGGGYPGLPIAAALPMTRSLLIEPVAKKARFLSVAIAATGMAQSVEAAPVRAEALAADPRHRGQWPAVTARAVASLAELIELAFPLLTPGGCLVAWKRGDLDQELAAADRTMRALGGGSIEVRSVPVPGLEHHRLVIATAHGRVPAQYPRDPAARKRRPW
jgi:16S rRNA (guanine527-N7)-methyltransferase